MNKTNIPAGGCPVAKTEAAGMPFVCGAVRRTKTEAGRMGRQGGEV